MTTVTLEIPDEIAAGLSVAPESWQAIIREALAAKVAKLQDVDAEAEPPVYQEIVDFLAGSPSPQQLIDFKIANATQQRLDDLLDSNREGLLTEDEKVEMETYLQFSHLMTRLKARARSNRPFIGES